MLSLNKKKIKKNQQLTRTWTWEWNQAFPAHLQLCTSGTHQKCRRKLYLSIELFILCSMFINVYQCLY